MAKVPKYRKHPNGQAFIQHRSIDRPQHRAYLGKYDSPESIERYKQFIEAVATQEREIKQRGGDESQAVAFATKVFDLTILELVAEYLRHCAKYYRDLDGKKTKEFSKMKDALLPLAELFPDNIASTFGPRDFGTYRDSLIARDLARTTINGHAGCVRRMFRWAAAKELLSPTIWQALAAVEGLKAGRTNARETTPIPAVAWSTVALALPHFSPVVAAMVEVQFWCGMRPQDVCRLRQCDLDTTGDVWLYRPVRHKNAWRGHALIKAIPKRVQPLLASRFRGDENGNGSDDAYLFSPREAVAWRAEETRRTGAESRATKEYPCERRSKERRRKVRAARGPQHRNHYTTETYRQAVEYGLAKLNLSRAKETPPLPPITPWSPMQLRHGIATLLEQTQGRQAAQKYLGHRHLSTTEIYIERDAAELIEIARKLDARGNVAG